MLELKMGLNLKDRVTSYRHTTLIIGVFIVVFILVYASLTILTPSYFPRSVKKGTKFSLYYPVNPPSGLSVDRGSFKSPQAQVITFTVNNNGKPRYYVSLEPVPNSFDPSVFQKNFIEVYSFQAKAGNALIGTLNTQLVGEVRTSDNTLVLINTGDVNSSLQLKALLSSFQKVQ